MISSKFGGRGLTLVARGFGAGVAAASCVIGVLSAFATGAYAQDRTALVDPKQYAALRWKSVGVRALHTADAKCEVPAGAPRTVASPAVTTHQVCSDAGRKGLLYAATTNGVYVSFDDGVHWQSLELDMPAADVRQLRVASDDLIAGDATQKVWMLEDVSPLRQAGPDLDSSPAYLLEPTVATAERGATIDYYLRQAPNGEVTIEVRNAQRKVVQSFNSGTGTGRLTKRAGLNRLVWNLRCDDQVRVPVGKYEVTLIAADTIMKRALIVQ